MFSVRVQVNKRLTSWAIPKREPSCGIQSLKMTEFNSKNASDEYMEETTDYLLAAEMDASFEKLSPTEVETIVDDVEETKNSLLEIQKVDAVYKCDICGASFLSRVERNEHIDRHFETYACSDCGQAFVGDRQFEHHKQNRQCTTHIPLPEDEDDRTFECYICHKSLIRSMRSLRIHMSRYHSEKEWRKTNRKKCPICNKTFANVYILRVHIDEIHREEKFQCDTCGKKFRRMPNLKMHQLIHENKMPCKCKICGKSFRTMSGVHLHLRTHTGEKPYKCDICNERSYSYNTDLKRHKRSAHGIVDKTFSCPTCNRIFYEPKYLRSHIDKVH